MNMKTRSCLKLTVLFMASIASALSAWAINPLGTNDVARLTEARIFVNDSHEVLPYRVYMPDNLQPEQKVPLVIFLHGSGECGVDNFKQTLWGPDAMMAYSREKKTPVIIVAPQCPRGEVWAPLFWHAGSAKPADRQSKMGRLVKELTEKCIATMPVDKDRVLLTGLSLGGYGVWDILWRYPDMFAAAMPVCGGGYPETCRKFASVPIWVFHGEKDQNVPVKLSRAMVAELWRLDAPVRYREFPDAGHAVWSSAYRDDGVLKWFFSQRRKPQVPPGSVYF